MFQLSAWLVCDALQQSQQKEKGAVMRLHVLLPQRDVTIKTGRRTACLCSSVRWVTDSPQHCSAEMETLSRGMLKQDPVENVTKSKVDVYW